MCNGNGKNGHQRIKKPEGGAPRCKPPPSPVYVSAWRLFQGKRRTSGNPSGVQAEGASLGIDRPYARHKEPLREGTITKEDNARIKKIGPNLSGRS